MSHDPLEARLDELLGEPLDRVLERERTSFDELAGGRSSQIVLWGAGRLGRKTLAGLRRIGVEPLAFCDRNPTLWGATVEGVTVISPEVAAGRYGRGATFVITVWGPHDRETMAERRKQLLDLGCRSVVSFAPLFWKHPDVFGSYYAFDLPHRTIEQADEVRQAFRLWADSASRAEFVAQVEWRIRGDFGCLSAPVDHEIYFPDDLVTLRADELFVDCGAYDGDTIRSLLKRETGDEFRVIAFEPDPTMLPKLNEYLAALPSNIRRRIELRPEALGATRSMVAFDATGDEAAAVGAGSTMVQCVRLDDALAGRTPTYIKMDIEGSEPEAIAGAERAIAESAPVLAVCVYHKTDHPWRIPLAIASRSDRFRFFLRPHHLQAWDLVCYAVPNGRDATTQQPTHRRS